MLLFEVYTPTHFYYFSEMRNLIFLPLLCSCIHLQVNAQAIFNLKGEQHMLITGKGPGQDATINPFQGKDCYVIVENLGDESFSVRIQEKLDIVKFITVLPKEKEQIRLLSTQELYIDSQTIKSTKASVTYKE